MSLMDLKSILSRETVALGLKGRTKEELIDELLQVAARSGKISDMAAARKAVLERERRMSTGMKHGIAIPHGKTDAVKDLVACIGVSDLAVDFDALDREPCRIFIMTLSPADKTGPHLAVPRRGQPPLPQRGETRRHPRGQEPRRYPQGAHRVIRRDLGTIRAEGPSLREDIRGGDGPLFALVRGS